MTDIKSGKVIGLRIKQRRKELGLSQEKLAEALDVSYQQIQRYENGANLLNTDKLQLVADFLDVPVSYFFDEQRVRVAEEERHYLPSEDMKHLRLFKSLDEQYKKAFLQLMRLATKKR